jgi:alpha-tubulin suppressor-like RCC1 family protein
MTNSGFKLNGIDILDQYVTKADLIDYYDNIVPGHKNPQLFMCGSNTVGGLGDNTIVAKSSPIQVGSMTNWKYVDRGIWSGLSSFAIKTDGTLWTWGSNNAGQLGSGTIVSRSSPVQVGALTNWKTLDGNVGTFVMAVKTDGTLWSWGAGTSGASMMGTLPARSSPVQIGALTNWKSVVTGPAINKTTDVGQFVYATAFMIKTDGTLWASGKDEGPYLGAGLTPTATGNIGRSSPVQVGSGNNWKQVSTGGSYSVAVKTDGTLWTWGMVKSVASANEPHGMLGLGLTYQETFVVSTPVQIGSLTNWKYVSAGARIFFVGGSPPFDPVSSEIVAAIKTDGTLWTWGGNPHGQLGHGDLIPRSSPVQVGSLTDWKYVHTEGQSVFALKTDGTLWAWGRNNDGQLGLGDIVNRSSPVQVGSRSSWKRIFGSAFISDGLED